MPQAMTFNRRDWYWYVGASTTQVYASARNIYVDPTTDTAFLAWKAMNGDAFPIPNEAEIWFYVQEFQPPWLFDGTICAQPAVGAYTETQLTAYAATVRYNTNVGGMTASGIPVATDDHGKLNLNDARVNAEKDSSYTTTWVGTDGNHYAVNATTIIAMSDAVAVHTDNCITTYDTVVADITAGTTTTLAEIDAAFAAIPTTGGVSAPPTIVRRTKHVARRT
jgi:hypothetical protein